LAAAQRMAEAPFDDSMQGSGCSMEKTHCIEM
jgi:hypothetical protein